MLKNLYAFTLGREWKLSLAELFSIFGEENYREHTELVAIFTLEIEENELIAKFRNIGGSVRVMRILSETDVKKFPTEVIRVIGKPEGKYHFALGSYGCEIEHNSIGLRMKKTLSESGTSARLVNIENKNINAASWKKEKLGKSQSEFNLITISVISKNEDIQNSRSSRTGSAPLSMAKHSYLGVTLACQDVDAYAKRDTDKSRDMVVGMMPPKLCQMMINLALSKNRDSKSQNVSDFQSSEQSVMYDPFCGLGTFLIEAANMGIQQVYGSDISQRMVASSEESLKNFIKEEMMWQDRIKKAGGKPAKDFTDFKSEVFEQDASKIGDSKFFREILSNQIVIASEGYLGEMMSAKDINLDRIKTERHKLAKMYDGFFSGIKNSLSKPHQQSSKSRNQLSLVMSFPFWSIHDEFVYFSEIYEIIEKYRLKIVPLLPREMKLNTMKGSLLYRRSGQTVGREIIKITL